MKKPYDSRHINNSEQKEEAKIEQFPATPSYPATLCTSLGKQWWLFNAKK